MTTEMSFWKKTAVSTKRAVLSRVSSSGPSTDIPKGTFGRLSVSLVEEVLSSPSKDAIFPTVLLSAVRLVHGRSLWLLLAMVCCIQ